MRFEFDTDHVASLCQVLFYSIEFGKSMVKQKANVTALMVSANVRKIISKIKEYSPETWKIYSKGIMMSLADLERKMNEK